MTPYAAASPAAYQQQAILTAPPERLVVLLYDGARRFFFQAATAMRDGEQVKADERLGRGEAIIDELLATLNFEAGGQIAANLQSIYVFCKRQLLEARLQRDPRRVEWVSAQLGELREAWAQIGTAATAA